MSLHVPAFNSVQVYGPDPKKAFGGLTPQQYRYCKLRSKGETKRGAYREAYVSQADDAIIAGMADKLESLAHISSTINQMASAVEAETSLVPKITVTRDFVLEGIVAIATKDLVKDNVRLRAYELLGKTVGLFKDEAPTVAKPRTIEDIDRELRERLQSMRTIEGAVSRPEASTLEPDNNQSAQTTGDRRRKPKV